MPEFLIAATNALCAGAAVLVTYIAWWAPQMEAYRVAIKILKQRLWKRTHLGGDHVRESGSLCDGDGKVVVEWESYWSGHWTVKYAGSERVRKMILEHLR